MFFEPERSQYDIHFRILGVDVRVHPFFWLFSAFLGWSWLSYGLSFLVMWVAAVFVSVLIHELGHVLVGRFFGSHGHIVLYSFGGLAIGSTALANRWQRIAVLLAGPFAQLPIWAAIWWIINYQTSWIVDMRSKLALAALLQLQWINWAWPLLNLLPIYPLDGGQVTRELFTWKRPESGLRASLGLSMFVAGLLAVCAFAQSSGHPLLPRWMNIGGGYMALLFALLAFSNFQQLQMPGPTYRRYDFSSPDDDDRDSWRG